MIGEFDSQHTPMRKLPVCIAVQYGCYLALKTKTTILIDVNQYNNDKYDSKSKIK